MTPLGKGNRRERVEGEKRRRQGETEERERREKVGREREERVFSLGKNGNLIRSVFIVQIENQF